VPTAEEIDRAAEQLRERQASWEPVEGEPVGAGMLVEAEVHGSYQDGDGEPFHEERSLFAIGSNEVFPEIEAAVSGRAVGDRVTAERVIGDEAPEDRRGKRIAYEIVINGLRRKRLPELDDAFAASMGVEGGVAVFKEKVEERIRQQKREQRREIWRDALVTHLAGGATLDLPESVVAEDTRKELIDFARALAARGIDPEQAKVDWSKLEPEMRQRVERRLRTELLLDALAEKSGIEVPTAEVDREVEIQARQLKVPFAELRGNLAKSGGLDRIRAILRRERATDQVLGRFAEGS
jgi:trigger factor